MKNTIEALLKQAVHDICHEAALECPSDLQIFIERPRDKTHGDFATNAALLLAKPLKKSPRQIAELIVNQMQNNSLFAAIDIAGPGFINFTLANDSKLNALESMATSDSLGVVKAIMPQTIVVDYSSPNLAKEMHVGHLRSTIIGDAIARVLKFKGHHVILQNHVGDWGTQFGMLLAHLEDTADKSQDNVELKDLETFYKAAKKRFDEEDGFAARARAMVVKLQSHDAHCYALWQKFINISLSHCQDVYARLNVMLKEDNVRAESAYNDALPLVIKALEDQGLLVSDEGAKCVFLPEFKGKEGEPLPIIVQKSDGGYLYATTDLAAINYRQHTLNAHRVIYVVDARQSLHFNQMFSLAKKAHFASPNLLLEHVGFGMVLDKQGRPYKSRDGGVTKLADLLDEATLRAQKLIAMKNPEMSAQEISKMAQVVGISAVKYADLSKNRISDYIFDWDTMISFEGNTAPYLLYAYTRIQSLLAKAPEKAVWMSALFTLQEAHDDALAKHLLQWAEVIDAVDAKTAPHLLCTYLYELAGLFSSFYEACPILNSDDEALRNSRLKLANLTAKVLKQGLELLGLQTLERM